MELEVEKSSDGISTIRLIGRMDVEGTNAIDTRLTVLAVADQASVVVDLQRVDFLTSFGIRALMLVAKALRVRGGRMAISSPGEAVRRVLEMAGIDAVIPVFETEEAAKAALSV